MRRIDRQITAEETADILERGIYGVLSTVSTENFAYGVPLTYCLMNGFLYFHCAAEGKKLDNLSTNPRVSFCVVGHAEVLSDKFSIQYESVIVEGSVSEVFDDEKRAAFEGLLKKYSSDYWGDGLAYLERQKKPTRMFKITPTSLSGKARR